MHKQIALKAAVLTPVVLATWLFTTLLVGGMKPKVAHAEGPPEKTVADDRPRTVPATRGKTDASGKPLVTMTRNGFTATAKRTASAALPQEYRSKLAVNRSEILVEGRRVSVNAAMDIATVRRDLQYVWRLAVYPSGEDRPIREHAYTDQAFEIHPSGQMTPTFSETFQLPPGKYRIRLALQRLAAGAELDAANLPSDKGSVGVTRDIEVK